MKLKTIENDQIVSFVSGRKRNLVDTSYFDRNGFVPFRLRRDARSSRQRLLNLFRRRIKQAMIDSVQGLETKFVQAKDR